jgi:hypothetical protein
MKQIGEKEQMFSFLCVGISVFLALIIFGATVRQYYYGKTHRVTMSGDDDAALRARAAEYGARLSTLRGASVDRAWDRDPFSPIRERVVPVHPFQIKEIIVDPFFIVYMGSMQRQSEDLIAQINWRDETFFVREGERMKTWTIATVSPERVIAVNEEGEEVVLALMKKAPSRPAEARLFSFATEKTHMAKAEDVIEGYKIIDIKKDTVILRQLSSDKIITITK